MRSPGIQVCAILGVVGDCDPIKTVMGKTHPTSLILSAGWIQHQGFTLDILFPTPTILHLGRGIITDPIELKIILDTSPMLKITGGAIIPVQKQEPLHLTIDLALEKLGASVSGHMSSVGGWKNPFGVSENLVLGPDLILKMSIVYVTFLETGPSGFGLVGGLEVGKVAGQIAFNIDEIPSREYNNIMEAYCNSVQRR
jgi:hypothetical protein